jgi:hypothetical protein
VKYIATLAAVICILTGCNKASQSQEAIRQGVIDYVAAKVNVGAMDVIVTSVDFKGAEAEATVEFKAKGASSSSGLQMRYTMEQKAGKWVVKDKAQAGGSPHGAGAGQGANPHGGAGAGGELPAGHPPLEGGARQ